MLRRNYQPPESLILLLIAAGVIFAIWGFFEWRTRKIPQCWKCKTREVRHYDSRNSWTGVARAFGLRTYQCSRCMVVYYAFATERQPPAPEIRMRWRKPETSRKR